MATPPDLLTGQPAALEDQPRRFGFWPAYFLCVASMVGAGILTSSGFTLKDTANPAGLMVIWALGGLLALCGTVTIAELATRLPHAGADYLFVREAFGKEAGIVVGWATFVLGFAAPTAVVARLSAAYFLVPFTTLGETGQWGGYLEPTVATLFVAVLTFVHCLGHRESGWVQVVSTLVKLVLLLGLVVLGIWVGEGDWSHFAASHVPDQAEFFVLGVGLVYVGYSYTGWNAAAYVAGEVREPEKLLPRSLIAGCLTVVVLYLLVNLAYIYALDPVEMTQLSYDQVQPVAQLAAERLFGSQIGGVLSVLLGLGMFASVSAYILSGPRIAFAMASDGAFPKFAARLHPVRQIPVVAILVQGGLAIVMIWSGGFLAVLTYTAIGLAVISGLVVASIFPLRRRSDLPQPFRVPLYPLPPILYLGLTVWVVVASLIGEDARTATILSLATVLAGWVVAWVWVRKTGR